MAGVSTLSPIKATAFLGLVVGQQDHVGLLSAPGGALGVPTPQLAAKAIILWVLSSILADA